MKLQTKIQLFTSLFMIVLILLVNTSIYFLFYKISADSELDELAMQLRTIVETLNENPAIAKNELLEAYLPTDGMIRVIQSDGSPLMKTLTKDSQYTSLPKRYTTEEIHEVFKRDDGTNVAVIAKPIIWHDGQIVTLQISKHLMALKETMHTLFLVLMIASVFMIIPIIIAGHLLARFLLRPIHTLIQTMQMNIKKAEWKKINVKNHSRDELSQMEMTFNEMIDHLKANFQKQEQFVSDASHEMNTPISIVKSYAQLLKRRGKDYPELFDEAVIAIDSEADRMKLLVEQMLSLAKNQIVSKRETINIVQLCEEVKNTFSGAYTRDIQTISEMKTIAIMGNEDQLKQVIYILIDNALKYSEQSIQLKMYEKDQQAVVDIIDYGYGISADDQKRIFDRFYRIDKARSRDTGGTGLGLSIAKTIVNDHGGMIFVTSELHKGTTFTVSLPIYYKSDEPSQ